MNSAMESNLFTDRPLMTIRVSRDSGQTWGPERAVFNTDDLAPVIAMEWPPCKCPGCTQNRVSSDG